MTKMKIGYIQKRNLELNPHLTERFKFIESSYTRKITSRSDKVYSKTFHPIEYDEVKSNTEILKNSPKLMLVQEVVFIDDELRERMINWVNWANSADESEYDPFAKSSDKS